MRISEIKHTVKQQNLTGRYLNSGMVHVTTSISIPDWMNGRMLSVWWDGRKQVAQSEVLPEYFDWKDRWKPR